MATSRTTKTAKDFAEKSEVAALESKLASLEKLCAALQKQCSQLQSELQGQKSAPAPASADQAAIESLENRVRSCETRLGRLLHRR